MKLLQSALIFPETEPAINEIADLLIFFNSLSYYLPTESPDSVANDSMFFKTQCTGYVPAPLGDDLVRFNRLLREMETSRPGEFSRLFSAANAPVATGQIRDRDETSAGSIYSALHADAETKTKMQHKERLWQARLVLKLAEMLDRKENEVRQGLERISSVEQKVFASLEGLNEAVPDDLAVPDRSKKNVDIPQNPAPGTSALLNPLRVKAWAELYLADPSLQRASFLVSTNIDSGSILLDGFENTRQREAVELFSLTIPVFDDLGSNEAARDQYLASRNKLQAATKENLEYFGNVLMEATEIHDSAQDYQTEFSELATHVSAWDKQIKHAFPGNAIVFNQLKFYCFPGVSTTKLLQHLFRLKPFNPQNQQDHPSGILAIVKP